MNIRETLPADYEARRRALDPETSFIVSAPAGSGKTGLLTQRVLKLLARCDYPEELLAITFTRKAAQEMRHRIVSALHAANAAASASASPASAHQQLTDELAKDVLRRDQEQGWNLLLAPHRLRIQTIDSLCQSIVNQLPFNSSLTSFQRATENPDHLYSQTIAAFLQILKTPGPLRDDLDCLLLHLDNNVGNVEALLTNLLRQRNQWMESLLSARSDEDAQARLRQSLEILIEESIEQLKSKLAPWLPELGELARYAAENLQNAGSDNPIAQLLEFHESLSADASNLSHWQALVCLLVTEAGTWRKKMDVRQGFPTAKEHPQGAQRKQQHAALVDELSSYPELLLLIADLRALPAPEFDSQQWHLLEALTRLLPLLAAEFTVTCQEAGECDFNAIAFAALDALGVDEAPSELALKLDYRIQHILVDEFQDTSEPQKKLLEKLTAGWQPGDGRTLFVVGDAMQSCYGFRDANVSIFLGAQDMGIGSVPLEHVELTVNFRSDGAIVEWVNEHFCTVFPEQNDISRGAICYHPADTFAPVSENAGARLEAFVNGDRDSEAERVVDIVRDHLQRDDKSSIAILARTRSHLREILSALRSANISWQAKDVDPLANRMVISDLLMLTRALLDFSDRIAWLSILRAPWCGLDLHDLHQVANQNIGESNPILSRFDPNAGDDSAAVSSNGFSNGFPNIWGQLRNHDLLKLSSDGSQAVAKLVKVLKPALHQFGRKPLRQWLEGIWLALGGPATIANPAERHAPKAFFDLLERHTIGAHVADWQRFEQDLQRLYDSDTQSARLQVMTIHKAKGLEFDTVIIPGLDRPPRADDNELLLWQSRYDSSGQPHLLLSPVGEVGGSDPLYAYLKREKSIRQQLESARLLYIGCTRAVRHLYLLMNVQRDERKGEIKAPGKQSLASHLWTPAQESIRFVEVNSPLKEAGDEPEQDESKIINLHHILRVPPQWRPPALPRDDTLVAYRPQAAFADNEVPRPDMLLHRGARHVGSVLHEALCEIASQGFYSRQPEDWKQWIDSQNSRWQNRLREQGLGASVAAAGAEKIRSGITKTLADPKGQWLLDARHPLSHCELRLMCVPSDPREYIIDRLFLDREQKDEPSLWIVDYKSSEPSEGMDLEHFLAAECEQYRPQLQRYAEQVRRTRFLYPPEARIRAALYFPFLGIFRELSELND